MFEVIDNIEVPVVAIRRQRQRGPFAVALDGLQIGQGFVFDDLRPLKKIYPSVAPKRFPSGTEGLNKKFKIWQVSEGKVGVKRMNDTVVSKDESEEGSDA